MITEDNTELDPRLAAFLDARSAHERIEILQTMRPYITNDMIDTMAMACGVSVAEGDLDTRYADLAGCLSTIDRYEGDRGRLR